MNYKTYLSKNINIRVTAGFPAYPSGGVHNGIDYVLRPDKNIYCCSAGTVLFSGYGTGANVSLGNYLSVKMENGQIAYYAHMESKPFPNVGEKVELGQKIGIMGATGNVTGAHVHVALKSHEGAGNWIDPSILTGIPNAVGTYEIIFGGPIPPEPGKGNCLFVISSHCEKFAELGNVNSNVGYLTKGEVYKIKEKNGIQADGFYWVTLDNGYYAVVLEKNCYIGECKNNAKLVILIAVLKQKNKI